MLCSCGSCCYSTVCCCSRCCCAAIAVAAVAVPPLVLLFLLVLLQYIYAVFTFLCLFSYLSVASALYSEGRPVAKAPVFLLLLLLLLLLVGVSADLTVKAFPALPSAASTPKRGIFFRVYTALFMRCTTFVTLIRFTICSSNSSSRSSSSSSSRWALFAEGFVLCGYHYPYERAIP